MTELQVVLVDDHLALRKGIELLLRTEGVRVVGSTESVEEARGMISRRRPDVAVIDIGLGEGSGLELAKVVLAAAGTTKVLLYTGLASASDLRDGMNCGATGLALKAGSPTELVQAIRTVAAGGRYLDPRVEQLLGEPSTAGTRLLTNREREVLALLAEGLTSEDIAAQLVLSPRTVQSHVQNLMQKLGARSRAHALAIAMRRGEA